MNGFETYCMYLSLKSHFTQKNYDFIKYNGKVRATGESFQKRKDKYQFEKISRTYTELQMTDFLVSNFIMGKSWIGEFLEPDAKKNHDRFQKHKESRNYILAAEIDAALTTTTPSELFRFVSGQYPPVVLQYMTSTLSPETLVILNDFIGFVAIYDKKFGPDDPIWTRLSLLLTKLSPFVPYDKEKTESLLRSKLL